MADESILVVDDDEFMLELLTESLTDAGYAVVTAKNGNEALDVLNHQDLQIALIDLSLPDMEGMDLVPHVTNTSPDAQIIIMTGYPTIESVIDSLREGAQDYIVKPFKIPEVHAAVSRSLKNQKLQAEVRELRRRVRDLEQGSQRARPGVPAATGAPRPSAPRPAGLTGAYGGTPARSLVQEPAEPPVPDPPQVKDPTPELEPVASAVQPVEEQVSTDEHEPAAPEPEIADDQPEPEDKSEPEDDTSQTE